MPTAQEIDCAMGKIIRYHRRAADLTQSDLGSASGVKFQQVQKYETGANRISISRLFAIARALQVTPVELIALVQEDIGYDGDASRAEHLKCLELLSNKSARALRNGITNLNNPAIHDALVKLITELQEG
ncbi:anaerobic benzoate catabolism transcriptional regulator [Roseovarius albus]|uniref:Anaerobic benzoate catabolism transcriptional regulator n=1 Tax=Roseovarius albus TaxID=1247867 RepID=A0A1X6Z7R2_9RHOB|nr:helix-turn-helix transcriptional regulator [Roseovarius albus]SLN43027.1 anaerobic benzoate catabolism transcriptional regulator [Roseovarius albus]